jgi:arylsulfatase A-like enzyme
MQKQMGRSSFFAEVDLYDSRHVENAKGSRMRMFVVALMFLLSTQCSVIASRPKVVWIAIEDAPHIGCSGESAIRTPAIDGRARDGIRFTHAFVTATVCSASRSAMVSGMYQITLGAHNHRSQTSSGKGGTSAPYFDSYKVPSTIKLVPELFRDAGYYVTNKSKADYNFIPNSQLYHGRE